MLRGLQEDDASEPRPGFHLRAWNCGTTACAVGHACLNPVFQKQGLRFGLRHGNPIYDEYDSWYAVERFFGLSERQATYLFYDEEYPDQGKDTTAAEVADRIESFLAEHAEAA